MDNPSVICLLGPTASGKTQLAYHLCDHYPCDIISVDSAMVYRGMDIGTAKPTPEELAHYPHRLIDIREPSEAYSAADFRMDAIRDIDAILSKKRIPLLVGGTMLYFHVLQQGLAVLPPADARIRADIEAKAKTNGWLAIHKALEAVDAVSAQKINPNDPQRLTRALEVYQLTGKPMSLWLKEADEKPLPYHFLNIGLLPEERAPLHEAIAKRFHTMLEKGFVEEVKNLYARGDLHADVPAMRAVGYRQVWAYLAGELSYDEMVERGIIATRQLAKRQITWLRSWPNLQILNCFQKDIQSAVVKVVEAL